MNKMRTAFISSDSELNNAPGEQLGSSEQGDESMLMLVSNYRPFGNLGEDWQKGPQIPQRVGFEDCTAAPYRRFKGVGGV